MNPVCQYDIDGYCLLGNNCIHEKPPSQVDVEHPLLTLGAAASIQQVQQTSTIEPTTVTAGHDNNQNTALNLAPKSNQRNQKEPLKNQLEQDLQTLGYKNAIFDEIIASLETSVNNFNNKFKRLKKINSKLIDEYNEIHLNEDNRCSICCELFIKPSMPGCKHIFCEWCIDRWLVEEKFCPICRTEIVDYTHCLDMDNYIQKIVEKLPAKERLSIRNLEVERAEDKPKCLELRAKRERMDFIAYTLNRRR